MRPTRQQEVIRSLMRLKRHSITRGNRQFYWVGYIQNDVYCREYHLTNKQALDRCLELERQKIELLK